MRRSSAASALGERPAIALALEGSVPVPRGVSGSKVMDSAWYLGGFCFGHGSKDWNPQGVGRIGLELQKEGWLRYDGSLWLALYDDEDAHWKAVLESWEQSSCQEKLDSASYVHNVDFRRHIVTVKQTNVDRHWHVTLLGCGFAVQDPGYGQTLLHYKVSQWNSLWTFDADNWRPAACPFNPANLLHSINVHEILSV